MRGVFIWLVAASAVLTLRVDRAAAAPSKKPPLVQLSWKQPGKAKGKGVLAGQVTLPASEPGRAIELAVTAASGERQLGGAGKTSAATLVKFKVRGLGPGEYTLCLRVDRNGDGAFDASDWSGCAGGATPAAVRLPDDQKAAKKLAFELGGASAAVAPTPAPTEAKPTPTPTVARPNPTATTPSTGKPSPAATGPESKLTIGGVEVAVRGQKNHEGRAIATLIEPYTATHVSGAPFRVRGEIAVSLEHGVLQHGTLDQDLSFEHGGHHLTFKAGTTVTLRRDDAKSGKLGIYSGTLANVVTVALASGQSVQLTGRAELNAATIYEGRSAQEQALELGGIRFTVPVGARVELRMERDHGQRVRGFRVSPDEGYTPMIKTTRVEIAGQALDIYEAEFEFDRATKQERVDRVRLKQAATLDLGKGPESITGYLYLRPDGTLARSR